MEGCPRQLDTSDCRAKIWVKIAATDENFAAIYALPLFNFFVLDGGFAERYGVIPPPIEGKTIAPFLHHNLLRGA